MYRCPKSHVPLISDGGKLVDADRQVSYEIVDGVANFLRSETVPAATLERLAAINRKARETSYLHAIDELNGGDEGASQYITDSSRHGYVDLLNLSKADRVLEIGCSMGQCTSAIARRCAEVWAMDIVQAQAEFTSIRCAQDGLTNVHAVAGGDDASLPFEDSVFDVVVMNLVLEWCGSRSTEDHQVVQRRMLEEISRVLRPGGRAWISTKNRYSMRLLLGGGDEHMRGIRFGSALPRWIGRRMLAGRGVARPDGYLYSNRGLELLIRSCGFDRADAYWAVPDPRHPVTFLAASARSVRIGRKHLRCPQGPGRWVSRAIAAMPSALVKHVAAGNCFVATKGKPEH